jgi:hypothetical protein
LGGLGLSTNYGYTNSGISGIEGRSDHPRLLRLSPNAFNISPTFDWKRVSARVGMSFNQANIYSYQYADGTPGGVRGPLSDIYLYSHFQVDAQGSVRMTHGLSFVAYGLDLNNEVRLRLLSGQPAIHDSTRILPTDDRCRDPLVLVGRIGTQRDPIAPFTEARK